MFSCDVSISLGLKTSSFKLTKYARVEFKGWGHKINFFTVICSFDCTF